MTSHTGGEPKKDAELEPVEEQDLDERVRLAHGAGMTQGQVAAALGVTRWSVRKSATRQGLEWPNVERTAAATKAAAARARLARVALAERWSDMAEELLDRAERGLEDPAELWSYLKPAAVATDKLAALARVDAYAPLVDEEQALEEPVAFLGMMFDAIHRAAKTAEVARAHGATEDELAAATEPR